MTRAALVVAVLRGIWRAIFGPKRPLMRDTTLVGLAYGDGLHDDAANIQRAIDRAGRVALSSGTFAVAGTIQIGSNQSVTGAQNVS